MGFSIGKILKRENKDEQQTNIKNTKQADQETKTSTQEARKKKHDEPGVCCGSCS